MFDTLSTQTLLIMSTAIALGAFAKGLTGLGLPLLAVPAMAAFIGADQAILTMVLPALLTNTWLAWQHRDQAVHVPELPRFVLPACIGIAVGGFIFKAVNADSLSVILGGWILFYLIVRLAHPNLKLSPSGRIALAPWTGLLSGLIQATTAVPGPTVATYFHAGGMPPRAFVFATASAFTFLAAGQLFMMMVLGLYGIGYFFAGLLVLIPAVVFMRLGVRCAPLLKASTVNHFTLALLGVMAVRLLYSGWAARL